MTKLIPITIVFFLSLIAVLPLFSPGFFLIHDDQQVVRLFELHKTLSAGTFPARWVPDLGFGFGYPLFSFYPPLIYYLGEVFHLLGFGFIDSIKIVWAIALFGSAISMYFLAKEFYGKIGGLVSAMFYLYAPYHAVDAYVRGALAELFSFVWLPLILLFAHKTFVTRKTKYAILTGIFLALLMITHNLIFLPFVGFFTLWCLAHHLIFKGNIIKSFIFYLLSLILGFALSAFFWLPSLVEKKYTLVNQFLTTGLADYKIHFVCLPQLWNSLWGFGGSIAGCVDGVSFKLGKPHIVISIGVFFISLLFYLKNRMTKSFFYLLSSTFFLLVLSVFMTTQYSKFFWDRIPLLWYLQFPWRFLEFAALFSSLLAGGFTLIIKKTHWQVLLASGLIFSVIWLHGKYFVPQTFFPLASDATKLSDQEIKWTISQTSFEYMPKGIATKPTPQGSYMLNITSFPTQKYLLIFGDWNETGSSFAADRFQLDGYSQNGAQIQFQITNFPGWKIWLDGKPASIDDANSLKLITINIPPGSHHLLGRFTNTPVRSLGNAISLSVIISLGLIFLYGRRRH